jgi:dienelactone hydrolase
VIAESVDLAVDGGVLPADLGLPERARGIVVFAERVGRTSVQNSAVAAALLQKGFGALVFDLLTAEEVAVDARRGALRFDIGFLGRRLVAVLDSVRLDPRLRLLPIALLGSGTAAAAALLAAADRKDVVGAVVARGGRPDLAMPVLRRVRCPTLLCAGGRDLDVVRASQQCLPLLPPGSRMLLIPGAGPAFDDPSAIASIARASSIWFHRHLAPAPCLGAFAPEQR